MNPYKGLKNIPRNVWTLAFATLINRSGTMVLPFLTLYLNKQIGLSASKTGLVFFFFGLGSLITSVFAGKLADKIGELKIIRYSLYGSGILLLLFSFVTNFVAILLITLLWAIVGEAFRPANLSLLSTEANPDARKTAFSLNRLAINLGMSIGPVIGGFLSQINFTLLFYVDAITSILAGVLLAVVKFEKSSFSKKEINHSKDVAKSKKAFSILHDKRMMFYAVSLIPVSLVFFQLFGAFPLFFVKELGYTESTLGLLMAINTVIIIFVEVPLNNAMESWDDRNSLLLGGLLVAIGFGLYAVSTQMLIIILAIIIWTFGEMVFFPASASYTSKISPEDKRGEYMGYFQMTFSTSLMLGPWLGTIVLQNYGSQVLWIACFVSGMISVMMFYRMKKLTYYHKN